MAYSFATLLGMVQAILLVLFLALTTTPADNDLTTGQYIVFRDILIMLLLGFGFLMAFLYKYGLSAVGLTMMLTALAIQLNLFLEPLMRYLYSGNGSVDFPLPIGIPGLIDGEFSAAALLISFGCVLGRASPGQLCFLALLQGIFYSINKVMIVFGALGAEDVGGTYRTCNRPKVLRSIDTCCSPVLNITSYIATITFKRTGTITIHMFGAYFGIAVARAFRSPKPRSLGNAKSSAVSDVFSLLGCGILWVYWPSFVGATETASPSSENLCVVHTVLALLGSTLSTFYVSRTIVGKLDPVHIANATLAGGVAVGASARLDMTPGGALLLGILSGITSTVGYVYVSPLLEARLGTYDTCGVHNLHGMPSIVGGLASAVFVSLDSNAEFLEHGRGTQAWRQVLAVISTVAFALVSGWLTGLVLVKVVAPNTLVEYDDAAWWESEYLGGGEMEFEDDKSNHSRGSILPVTDDNATSE